MAASFSSRGPSSICPGIGPVVSILAASPFPIDKRKSNLKSNFNVMSGTSMSCPHLSGIAALLKRSHADWSPAAIKSAIMTTAEVVNQKGQPSTDETLQPASVFAIGAGHPNPSKANDPGLVAPPQGISVSIKPKLITFSEVNQNAKYAVTFRRSKGGGKSDKTPLVVQYAEGSLTWGSDQYSVRSPIAVKLPLE
ncbi:hypothetical protein ACE6H2_017092 [Prunus campanulata]